jgi:hypothetical protein
MKLARGPLTAPGWTDVRTGAGGPSQPYQWPSPWCPSFLLPPPLRPDMSDDDEAAGGPLSDLDLQAAEGEIDDPQASAFDRVELGVLDGSVDPEEWVAAVNGGAVLVLDVEGDLNELAAGFARDVRELGGELMHFRGFLVVSPPDVEIDTGRL